MAMSDRDRVAGDYQTEMLRRHLLKTENESAGARLLIIGFGLIVFALWPLGLWHVAAGLGGGFCIFQIARKDMMQLADELDLLEEEIARQGRQLAE